MPGIERAPRAAQRLLRFQHDGEFGEIEAADIDQRAGALLPPQSLSHARRRRRLRASVTAVNGGGRCQFRRERAFAGGPCLQRHWFLALPFLFEYL